MKALGIGFVCVLVALSVFRIDTAQAQTTGDFDRARERSDRILQQREQEERERRERENDLRRTPSGQTLTPRSSGPLLGEPKASCSEVKDIVLQGATLLSAKQRRLLTSPYIHQCLSLEDINRLIADITNAYVVAGYVTSRVYIPAQDLSTGTLQLLVIEGRTQSLVIHPPQSANASTAFPKVQGEFLNLRDLEQGLDQLNRLRSNSATIDIEPGASPGASQIVIDNKTRKRWQLAATADNSGTRSTGEHRQSLWIGLDNLLRLNDSLTLNASRSGEGDEYSRSGAVSISLPYGYWTLSGSASTFEYGSVVEGSETKFETSGTSESQNITIDRMLYRDQLTKWELSGGATRKRIRNEIERELLDSSSHDLTVLSLETNLTRIWNRTLFSLSVGANRGVRALGASEDADDLPHAAPQFQYLAWTYALSASRSFAVRNVHLQWNTEVRGLYSNDVLYGTEELALGTLYTVRGFRESTISGNRGVYLRNSFALPLSLGSGGWAARLQPNVGYDVGHINGNPTLSGWTAGCDLTLGPAFAHFAYSRPIHTPNNKEDGWLYGSVTFSF
jgi:hemolysin activation/secretion protein